MSVSGVDLKQARILIVGAVSINLKLLCDILSGQGYNISFVSDGRSALQLAIETLPDLVLLDICMSKTNGYELCRSLKAGKKTRDIPIIFIYTTSFTDDKLKGFEVGGIDYITAPFLEEEIFARVNMHLTLNFLQKKLEERNLQLHREIIERTRSEDELKKQQERLEECIVDRTQELNKALSKYQGIFENSVEGIFQLSAEGRFISCNPALANILGYDDPEVLTGMLGDILEKLFVDSKRRTELTAMMRRRQDVKNFEVQLFRKDGFIIWVSLNIRPLFDEFGNFLFVDGILQDITERKTTQRVLLENTRIKRELEIAKEIQQSFLPKSIPKFPGISMACRCEPAANVGGDYYDFFCPEEGVLDIVIADVAGHSVGSALMMSEARSILRARAGIESSPARILASVNRILYEDLTRAELLSSMFYARLYLKERAILYSNAGHSRPLLFHVKDGVFEELDAEGMLMGIKEDVFFEEKKMKIQKGDLIFLYTDGIIESENRERNFFGTSRLCDVIGRSASCPPEEIVSAVFDAVSEFSNGNNHADDMTAVAIRIGQIN